MMAEVMIRRHTAPAHDRGGEGLNLCLCTVLQPSERMLGMGGEGLNPLSGIQQTVGGDDQLHGCSAWVVTINGAATVR